MNQPTLEQMASAMHNMPEARQDIDDAISSMWKVVLSEPNVDGPVAVALRARVHALLDELFDSARMITVQMNRVLRSMSPEQMLDAHMELEIGSKGAHSDHELALAAIEFAIRLKDHDDRLEFLKAWNEDRLEDKWPVFDKFCDNWTESSHV